MTAAVIVPVRGGDQAAKANLSALAAAAASAGVTMYVVDNGLTDWLRQSVIASGQVILVECAEPGSYLARNAGVRVALAAGHDVLLFTDADCRPEHDWPAHLLALADHADIAVSLAAPRREGVLGYGAHHDYRRRLATWAGGELSCGRPIGTLDTRACVIRSEVFSDQQFDESLNFAADAVFGRLALARGRIVIGCHHPVLSHDPPRSWSSEYLKYRRISGTLTEQLRAWPRRDVLRLLPEHAHLLLPPPSGRLIASRKTVAAAGLRALRRQPDWQAGLYRAVRELAWVARLVPARSPATDRGGGALMFTSHRFVPQAQYESARLELDLTQLDREAAWSVTERNTAGEQRLRSLIEYALCQVPAYAGIDRADWAERGLAAFPVLGKADLRSLTGRLARDAEPSRWNRTSGSTNLPLRTALGPGHERNQIVRWLRHWRYLGVHQPSSLLFLVPRAYRLRVFGGGALIDLAGGHFVYQQHNAASDRPPCADLVIANPHLLAQLYPDGWDLRPRVLVTSYEQRPANCERWPAAAHGDVYGLSEVGDIAWQLVGEPTWQVHSDLIWCEVLEAERRGNSVVGELVVTDLTNRVMPIVRYRTGDLVEALVSDSQPATITSIVGRSIQLRGTPLAGIDVMSYLLPALLDSGEQFRVGASADRVVVYAELTAAQCDRMRARLARVLPAVTVTSDQHQLAGLTDVLRVPAVSDDHDHPARSPAISSGQADSCRCAGRPLTIRSGSVASCDSGSGGRLIVCLPPGPGMGHQILRSLHEAFAGLGEIRLVEYPLHGTGDLPVADRDSLVAALTELLTGHEVLLGHSFGASLAVDIAARSHLVSGLILVSPPVDGPDQRGWSAASRAAAAQLRGGRSDNGWFRRYLADYALPLGLGGDVARGSAMLRGVPTYERAWRTLRHCTATEPLGARVAAAQVPALIVSGRDDPLVDRIEVARLRELANAVTAELPGSHFPFLDARKELRAAVSRFLAALPSSGVAT